jgi:hypothetical protein
VRLEAPAVAVLPIGAARRQAGARAVLHDVGDIPPREIAKKERHKTSEATVIVPDNAAGTPHTAIVTGTERSKGHRQRATPAASTPQTPMIISSGIPISRMRP